MFFWQTRAHSKQKEQTVSKLKSPRQKCAECTMSGKPKVPYKPSNSATWTICTQIKEENLGWHSPQQKMHTFGGPRSAHTHFPLWQLANPAPEAYPFLLCSTTSHNYPLHSALQLKAIHTLHCGTQMFKTIWDCAHLNTTRYSKYQLCNALGGLTLSKIRAIQFTWTTYRNSLKKFDWFVGDWWLQEINFMKWSIARSKLPRKWESLHQVQ
jgi:hypothetical protein